MEEKSDDSRHHIKNSYIAIILPEGILGTKFKPIPIEYISGDNKEEICIMNESLKIDSTGITLKETIDDFIQKFISNWKKFKEKKPASNYLYVNSPMINAEEYEKIKTNYFNLEEK